jgi:IS5 family transposase
VVLHLAVPVFRVRMETVVYNHSCYQGMEKRQEMEGKGIGIQAALRPGKRRALPNTLESRLEDLAEIDKVLI